MKVQGHIFSELETHAEYGKEEGYFWRDIVVLSCSIC